MKSYVDSSGTIYTVMRWPIVFRNEKILHKYKITFIKPGKEPERLYQASWHDTSEEAELELDGFAMRKGFELKDEKNNN